tara:strand:+ start:206 stop:1021 length:816 start_codon:yes stop_codon:yes gene_type:complete
MASSEVAICNSALIKLGAAEISSLSDTNKRAQLCNAQYSKLRDELLRSHPWNFAIGRKVLSLDSFIFIDGDVTTGTDQITETGHGRITGEKLRLTTTGVLPTPLELATDYFLVKVDDNNFKLATTVQYAYDGTVIDITAAAGTGNHKVQMKPSFEYDNQYILPTDYLRGIRLDDKEDKFTIEGGKLLTNNAEVLLLYIKQVTDTTLFDTSFDELLALMIANDLSYPLVQSNSLKATIQAELNLKLRDVRSTDAQEGNAEEFEANTWANSRL